MANILIIDDDPYIRELVGALLCAEGFFVEEAKNGLEALGRLNDGGIDLCILDLMMPKMDGFEFCALAREERKDLPVLMLTAKSEIGEKVKGFETGADDYLTKPFEGKELIMRVKALLRRYKIESAQIIKIGAVTIDKNAFAVTFNNVTEDIPKKEFELLFKLAGFPGRTFSRDKLIEDIWGYEFDGNERTLDVHINRLRERFPEAESGFKIKTLRGLGYRLEVL
jgi:DNA-binding response OmpR family regulator